MSCLWAAASPSGSADGSGTVTYSATQTIAVPPASNFSGSAGGDGWAVAVGATKVYNVFHHAPVLTVACHLQVDATPCWAPETITDTSGNNFSTSGHPGLWLNLSTEKLYVYGLRTSDHTGGVVCIDTALAATNPNPFCGFTALTAVGDATGIISAPALVGQKWYAFNYAPGAEAVGSKNKLMCFDTVTLSGCAAQPYTLAFGAGVDGDSTYPPPGVAAIGSAIIVPVTTGGNQQLACYDTSTGTDCGGSWPVAISSYNSSYGTPFPLLSPTGTVIGVCLPTGVDPCFGLDGASVPTPAGMTAAIPATSGWDGAAFVLGPRVYLANGNANEVDCYDSSTAASCTNFPRAMENLGLLYTVNPDPQRPTCIWVNADNGSAQIQNFDAYTGGPCGEGAIRVLGSRFSVPTVLCQPATYTSLQVLSPAPGSYTSGDIEFQDNDAQPIPGIADATLDGTGSVDLSGLHLTTSLGLPQFLVTLTGGSASPSEVTVKLTWTGVDDPSCAGPGITVSVPTTTLPPVSSSTLPPVSSSTLPPVSSSTVPPVSSSTAPPASSSTVPPVTSATKPLVHASPPAVPVDAAPAYTG